MGIPPILPIQSLYMLNWNVSFSFMYTYLNLNWVLWGNKWICSWYTGSDAQFFLYTGSCVLNWMALSSLNYSYLVFKMDGVGQFFSIFHVWRINWCPQIVCISQFRVLLDQSYYYRENLSHRIYWFMLIT